MAFDLVSSEVVFEGKVFDVRIDQVRFPDGHETRLDLVVHSGAVTLIPRDEDGAIWFVRQYRHAASGHLLELPAGTLETGEEPASAAARECREEIGMAPGRLDDLGGFYLAPGYSSEYMHVFLATDLKANPLAPDPDEILEIRKLSEQEVVAQIRGGGFQDAKTLAALQLAGIGFGISSRR